MSQDSERTAPDLLAVDPDLHSLEQDLRALLPERLNPAFAALLAEAVAPPAHQAPPVDAELERQLGGLAPVALSSELMERLLSASTAKPVLAFPEPAPATRKKAGSPGLAIAATVALLGAAAALLLPQRPATENITAAPTVERALPEAAPARDAMPRGRAMMDAAPMMAAGISPAAYPQFTPAAYEPDVRQAVDEGVIWRGVESRRVIRIIYADRYTMESPDGHRLEIEQPRTEFLIIPEDVQ